MSQFSQADAEELSRIALKFYQAYHENHAKYAIVTMAPHFSCGVLGNPDAVIFGVSGRETTSQDAWSILGWAINHDSREDKELEIAKLEERVLKLKAEICNN